MINKPPKYIKRFPTAFGGSKSLVLTTIITTARVRKLTVIFPITGVNYLTPVINIILMTTTAFSSNLN